MPSREHPLTGGCACGAVRFQVTEPFSSAGYCHCRRCQRRSGVPWSLNGLLATSAFELTAGAGEIRRWEPQGGGRTKCFCGICGGHVFSGDPETDAQLGVRFGALDGDPGIEPGWHAWVSSAPAWFPLPDDGLPRYPERPEALS